MSLDSIGSTRPISDVDLPPQTVASVSFKVCEPDVTAAIAQWSEDRDLSKVYESMGVENATEFRIAIIKLVSMAIAETLSNGGNICDIEPHILPTTQSILKRLDDESSLPKTRDVDRSIEDNSESTENDGPIVAISTTRDSLVKIILEKIGKKRSAGA